MHSSVQARKNKKNLPRKKFLIFQEKEPLCSNIKKILETDPPQKKKKKKKKILIFQETEILKNSYIFPKESSSFISGNLNPEKIPYVSEKELSHMLGKVYS